jgi:hypothetical protein
MELPAIRQKGSLFDWGIFVGREITFITKFWQATLPNLQIYEGLGFNLYGGLIGLYSDSELAQQVGDQQ